MAQSRCDRCGVENQETHKIGAVGWDGYLRRFRHFDGAFIGGDSIDLCGGCRDEFIAMLESSGRRYPDPQPSR